VYERASKDEGATGMGTTMTLALVANDRVVIGHVGDSRAYLVRDGELEQVTDDHSLVAELVRSGKLSPDEADSHPQRSVITRALGPDPNVDVDTFSVDVQPNDLFILCSDGLSSMIGDAGIIAVVRKHRDDLEDTARALIQAANEAGGEDNITVICFEIAAEGAESALRTSPTVVTGDQEDEEEDTLDELTDVPAGSITTIRPAPVLPPEAPPEREPEPRRERPPRRRRSRAPVYVVSALIVLALLVVAALWGISRAHFVGARSDGHVAVYQGIPYDIVDGIRLYRAVYVSPVLAGQLTQRERKRVFDHDLESKNSALATVRQLEERLGQQP
jgi:protein phosphatase